jgi:hypothetical protein
MKKLFLALAFAALAATPALAQPAQPSAEHVAVALETLNALDMQKQLDASIETALQLQFQQNPQLRELEGPMRQFFEKHMSWDALKDEYALIYARQFTVAELRQLAAFYRSPLGQKLAAATPTLMQEGAELGQRRVQENLPELMQLMMASMGGTTTTKP